MLAILGKELYSAEKIKKNLIPYLGKKVSIKYNLGRNKCETYKAKIIKIYNSVFLVEIEGENKIIKSFSFADIITKTIKLYD